MIYPHQWTPLVPTMPCLNFECGNDNLEELGLQCFELCLKDATVIDGVMSQSEAQAADLWRYREGVSEAITPFTPYKK